MRRTRVGYAGGTTPDPSYHKIGDHAECTEIDYSPGEISFSELLERFWEWHKPWRKPYARQYMSAVLYHDSGQRELVERDLERFQGEGRPAYTELLPYQGMTRAEDYHQKYYLRRDREAALALRMLYPATDDFVDSYAVMKVNSLLGGYLKLSAQELGTLGLPQAAIDSLSRPKASLWQKIGGLIKA